MIRQYVGLLDQRQLGLQVTAYVSVRMEKQPEEEQDEFHQLVAKEAHIVECHAMSGAYDFLMKVMARDMDHFAELCMLKFPNTRGLRMSIHLSV